MQEQGLVDVEHDRVRDDSPTMSESSLGRSPVDPRAYLVYRTAVLIGLEIEHPVPVRYQLFEHCAHD